MSRKTHWNLIGMKPAGEEGRGPSMECGNATDSRGFLKQFSDRLASEEYREEKVEDSSRGTYTRDWPHRKIGEWGRSPLRIVPTLNEQGSFSKKDSL